MIGEGSNEAAWSLIALDSRGYEIPNDAKWNRDSIIDAVLTFQNKNGGFGLNSNESADVDLTAMCIQGLAPYYGTNEKVKTAVDSALAYLKKQMDRNCDLGTSEGTAQTIIALTALKIDPLDEASGFAKSKARNLLTALEAYRVDGSGFKHMLNDAKVNNMSAIQAMQALVAYDRYRLGKTALYDLKDAEKTPDYNGEITVPSVPGASEDTDAGKTSVYREKMGELRIKYDDLFKEFSSMQQDYILKKIIAGYLGTEQGLFFDLQKMMKYAQKISDFTPLTIHDFEEIRKMSDPYYLSRLTRMNNRLLETIEANKKKKGYTVNESGEVKDEDLFYSITSKFKGKVILVDFWATWCGPCKMAMKQMEPMKKDLEGKDIVYVFIAGENSPKETWDNMIPDIHGEHYRVTAAQWNYLSKQFSIQGVPTYIIVDKEGGIIQKYTGFPGVDTVKKELIKALEK